MNVRAREQHDLRMASIHEAAHAVVVRHLGGHANACVTPSYTSDPIEEKLYVGHTWFGRRDLNIRQLMMVGLAGTVAEEVYSAPDCSGWSLFEALQEDVIGLSDSDAELVGRYTAADLDECIKLVSDLWNSIDMEAVYLAGTALDLLKQSTAPATKAVS